MTMKNLGAFGKSFQTKVLYSLLTDKEFLQNIADILISDYFDSPAHKWIIDYILQYYAKYNTHPTVDVLKVEIKKLKNDILQISIKEELKEAYNSTEDDTDYVKEEFLNFCKNQRMKEALLKSVDLLDAGAFEDIRRLMDNALKAGVPKDVGLILSKDIETRYREEEEIRVPFPWEIFNEITDGGLPLGSLCILMGGTGSGKSTTACHMALHAAKLGFNVSYYTLELSDKYVGKKIDSVLTGIEMKQLKYNRQLIEEKNAELAGTIVVKEFYPGRSTMDNIESHDKHIKNDLGIDIHLTVIDYPELLKPRKSRNDINAESNDIYTDIVGFAKERKRSVIAPSQMNRAGMKADIAEHDAVAGSIGKIFIADFSVTISRKRKDKLARTARFHILKSRLGDDGMTYDAMMDLKHNKIEILGEHDENGDDINLEQPETKQKIKQRINMLEQ